MPKIRDIIKAHPYIIINCLGLLLVLLCFLAESIARVGFGIALAVWLFSSEVITLITALFFIIAVNVFAFVAVKNNESVFGMIFTAFGGCIGGFAAVHTANKGYAKVRAVNLLFNAYIWIFLYAAASFILYRFDYYYFPLFH